MTVAFGTSMPTSITLVATSTSASPLANASIAACFAFERQLAVDELDPLVAELGGAQPLELHGGRLGLQRLRLLDQRADDEALAPRGDLLADPLVRARSARGRRRPRTSRPAAARPAARAARWRRGRRRRSATSVRGIGVAVMCSACGASPSGAFASSAARWRTPKRCCSSTTHDGEVAELHRRPRSARACRPPAGARPLPSAPSRSRRRAAGVEPVSSSSGTRRRAARSSVRWCCSASVSVGAISAAWAPFSTARSIACSATTVLPAPTSPISSRCIGRSRARSSSISAIALLLVAGQLERQRPAPAVDHDPARGRAAARGARRGGAPAPRDGELEQEQLLEGQPAARSLARPPRCPGSARRRARRRAPAAARPPAALAGSGSGVSRKRPRASHTSERRRAGAEPLRGRVDRHEPDRVHRHLPRRRAARAR